MIRKVAVTVASGTLLVTSLSAQELFNVTTGADVDALLPNPSDPAFLGRGGFTVLNGPAPDEADSIVVSGFDDGSAWQGAGFFVPGNETNGFAIPADALGKSYAFGCYVWLPSGHEITSINANLTWSADLNGNQILDPDEQWVGVTESPPGFGPNLVIVDAWQPLIGLATVPTNDLLAQPIGQVQFSIDFGAATPQEIYVRDISLTILQPAGTNVPVIASVQKAEGDLAMEVEDGPSAQFFNLLASTDAASPVGSWDVRQSELQYDGVGGASLSSPITGDQEYFRLQSIGPVTSSGKILFDYNNQPNTGDWSGFAGQTVNGIYCGSAGGIFGVHRAPTAPDAWRLGFLFPGGERTSTNRIVVTADGTGAQGTPIPFRLHSIDAEAFENTTNIFNGIAFVEGEPQVVWTLEPSGGGSAETGMPRYTEPTTGSFDEPISEIQLINSDAGWNNRFDNLVISTNMP